MKSKCIKTSEVVIFIILVFAIVDLSIFLDIPFMRQICGFVFLTILPGILIIHILKLNSELEFIEVFLYSIGLSISFLIFFGVLLNYLSLSLGYKSPLSITILLISFNILFILFVISIYKTDDTIIIRYPSMNLNVMEKLFLFIPLIFPALSLYGMYFMKTTDNNIILMFLLILISIYILLIGIFNQKFPNRLYPIVIFIISLSVILMIALRSEHLIGVDAHTEYYVFQTTSANQYWSISKYPLVEACIAVSLLPTIYQIFININSEILFNVFYSILFSLVPLVVFVISKRYIGEFYGFFASILFISQTRFIIYAIEGVRTHVAILFIALAMMAHFNNRINPMKKKFLFIVFAISCVLSHYSTTYIFFLILVGTFIGIRLLPKRCTHKEEEISLAFIIMLLATIFFWYSQVTGASFIAGVGFIEQTIINLNKFFVQEMRGDAVVLLGQDIFQKGIPHRIEFVLTWLILALIGIGMLNFNESKLLKNKIDAEYSMIALGFSVLLAAMVALPYVAIGYSMDRLYGVAICILAMFFIIGAITLSRYTKVPAHLIVLLVLIPYFLSVSGVTYQIFGYERAIILNTMGEQHTLFYVHDTESNSAIWLGNHADEKAQMYTDFHGSRRLLSQGKIISPQYSFNWLSDPNVVDGYIYLRYQNIVNGELVGRYNKIYDISNYHDLFIKKNKIYANNGSEVWI